MSGSLFGSTNNVLVEGYTDKLYLKTFSEFFRRQGEDTTFDYQTSLVDVDGSKTEYMVRFLDAENYDYTILLDDDDAEDAKSHKETLVEKDVDEDRIVLVSDVLDDTDEGTPVEIEDLLPADIFCEVVAEQ
ncbi:TOPRIM nucleotidyl transferase/hydrolase domain-containing protein [Halorussus sp. MSC15.2]|uniref:TOPRIM nucleotidyl transferase/hydrolase domain-containing protein n=1 Tax=Halorussus sp. MSC15.2 TaxID=2283638 RepID=UPI002815B091|nr:TOPRIM nucleotidyl transferase/hydrolase domain-containing protein [Halorussus sp. MSC15.2]